VIFLVKVSARLTVVKICEIALQRGYKQASKRIPLNYFEPSG